MNYFAIVFMMAALFMGLERILPGRDLPRTPHWFLRAMFFNSMQLLIIILAGLTWSRWLDRINLVDLGDLPGFTQGLIAWFIGTFVFYWWHRARHSSNFLWITLHQVHHSPARIETLTAFYKHPLEIISDSMLSSVILYLFVGASPAGAGWYYVFAAGAEFFYHSNLRTPAWIGYVMQRPEHHSIHHELGVHRYNYSDLTIWDRLFGTFSEAEDFAEECGFAQMRETRVGAMLAFRSVNPD